MQPEQSLDSLKADFYSADSQIATAAADRLGEIGGNEVLDFLLPILQSANPWLRNSAALALRDIGDNRALEPLLREINNPQNRHKRGTMVYALERLDCSRKLPELFELLFYGSYEVKMYTATILNEQVFEFSAADLYTIQAKWDDLKNHPDKSPDFEDSMEDIQEIVEYFMSYLH